MRPDHLDDGGSAGKMRRLEPEPGLGHGEQDRSRGGVSRTVHGNGLGDILDELKNVFRISSRRHIVDLRLEGEEEWC